MMSWTSLLPLVHGLETPGMAALAGALFASLWQGSLLVLLVMGALRLLPGLTAAARAAVWALVLVVIALHPVLAVLGRGAAEEAGSSAGLVHVGFAFSLLLVGVWAVASLFRLFQLLIGGVELWRTLRGARPLGAPAAVAALLRGSARQPELCASEDVSRPCVAGFFRPRLLLPADLLPGLAEAELLQIVLHELEHLRRGDDWVNLLQQIAYVVLPLHPAMFWVHRRLALERELACDDAVLRTTRAGKAYAACLAHVAEQSLRRRGLALAVGALGRRRSELTARVERILRRPERALSGLRLRLATGLVLTATLSAGAALEHGPTLVSFGAEVAPAVADGTVSGGRMLPVLWKPTANGFPGEAGAVGAAGIVGPRVVPAKMAVRRGRRAEIVRAGVVRGGSVKAGVVRAGLRGRGQAVAAPFVLRTAWNAGTMGRSVDVEDGMMAWPETVMTAPRLRRVVVVETQQVWYAAVGAVATPEGWLVVQL